MMNKTKLILVFLSLISIFFLTGCDMYEDLYDKETEFLPLEDISSEVDKTLEEVLPAETGEEYCIKESSGKKLSLTEAKQIALDSDCVGEGSLEETYFCNEITGTWWIDLDIEKEGCSPACVVNVETKEAEINWRCTGLLIPEEGIGFEEEEEPTEVEESGEESVVIIVQEKDLISLVPEAEDPDKEDKLAFTFSSPLSAEGEWQTNYGDAGEYTVTVTASDGQLTTSQDILIIINKKEESPTIDSFNPREAAVLMKETESIEFNVEASDLNKDKLSYSWKLDGAEVGADKYHTFKTTYDDSGSHTMKADISDGVSTSTQLWSVTVENINRKPILEEISNIKIKDTETAIIKPEASDPDKDEISFTISDPVGDDGVWETTYDDSGEYTVTVTASDGTDSVSQDVMITVENVNRPPVITGIVQRS